MDLGKRAHGMDFGWHQRVHDHWRVGLTSHGGAFERIQDASDINGELLIKFGNNFGQHWIKHTDIPHNNWRFWDNPEIPQLLNPNPANPAGAKDFVRFVPGGLFTTTANSEADSSRLESVMHHRSIGQITLEELIKPIPVRVKNTRKVLLCPSSPNCYTYYYNTTRSDWIEIWSKWCEKNGYEPEVRPKPERTQRKKYPNCRLYDTLVLNDFAFTISQHSVAAVESIMAGVPAVTTGPHPIGPLYTPPEWAEVGAFVTPEQEAVWDWIKRLASNTYHKSELFTGGWHK